MTRFIERTLTSLLSATEYAASAEELAEARGVLQSLDPRVKVVGLLCLIIAVAACRRLDVIAGLFAVAVGLAIASRIALRKLLAWVWIPVLFFTGAIALPAIFLTPGASVSGLPITATGTSQRRFSRFARGNFRHAVRAAGALDAVAACAESSAHSAISRWCWSRFSA